MPASEAAAREQGFPWSVHTRALKCLGAARDHLQVCRRADAPWGRRAAPGRPREVSCRLDDVGL